MTLLSSLLVLCSITVSHVAQNADNSLQAALDKHVFLTYNHADIRQVIPQISERYGLSGWMDADIQGQVIFDANGLARLRDVLDNILRQVGAKLEMNGDYMHIVKVDAPKSNEPSGPILKQAVAMANDEGFSYELDEGELRKVSKSDLQVVLKKTLEPLKEVKHYNLSVPRDREKFIGIMRLNGMKCDLAPEFTKQVDLNISYPRDGEKILQELCKSLDMTNMVLGGLFRCMNRSDVTDSSGQAPPDFYMMKMKVSPFELQQQKQGITCDDNLLYALSGGWRYEIRKSDLKVMKSTTADGY